MGDTQKIVWSRNGEDFNYDSLGDLIDSEGGDIEAGDTVSFGVAVSPSANFVSADEVIDMIGDRAYDIAGEHADDFPCVTDEAKSELSSFLTEWQAKHCVPTFWTVRNVKEYKVTAEDIEGAAP
jgi:hypothetical protein